LLAIGDFYQALKYVLPSIHSKTLTDLYRSVTRAGGGLGVATAFIAYYIGLSELLAAEDQAVFHLPLGVFPKRIQ
jgi:succinate-acetate transporter protein